MAELKSCSTQTLRSQIKSDQLLVLVRATSVNPIDWKIRNGLLKLLTGNRFPMVLGIDVSGEVVEGRLVTLQIETISRLTGGAYAEYVRTGGLSQTQQHVARIAAVPLQP